jgi:predicted nucleic acid-binding protein
MKALLDTNVLLDVIMRRPGFFIPATAVWKAAEERQYEAVVSAISFTTIHYLIGRYSGQLAADEAVRLLHKVFVVATVDSQTIADAIASGNNDFEDAVQAASAIHAGATHVITRDATGFSNCGMTVLAPNEWRKLLA